MARQKKFKKGELIVDDRGNVMNTASDQYSYRNKQVVDIQDGEVIRRRQPVTSIKRYDNYYETVEVPASTETIQNVLINSYDNAELSPNKYLRRIVNAEGQAILVDVYDVLEAFNVTCPAVQHLAKKALCVGIRGHKDAEQDLNDIQVSSIRAIQLQKNRS